MIKIQIYFNVAERLKIRRLFCWLGNKGNGFMSVPVCEEIVTNGKIS